MIAGSSVNNRDTSAHGNSTILFCDVPSSAGDNLSTRGIVFSVDQPFLAVEIKVNTETEGPYSFTAELRRSIGFEAPVEATSTVSGEFAAVNGNIIHFDFFPPIPVAGRETFSMKWTDISFPTGEDAAFFHKQQDSDDCPDTYETADNFGEDPQLRNGVPWVKVLATLGSYLWGDTKCDGKVDIGDALEYVRQLADVASGDGECPTVGDEVTITSQLTWGDWNCDGTANALDAVLTLAALADTDEPPDTGCRALGSSLDLIVS